MPECAGTVRPTPADPFFPDLAARRRVFAGVALFLALFGVTDVRRRLSPPPGEKVSSDYSCYAEAARSLAEGGDPYAVANARGWHYLYPPLLALLLVPVRSLPLDTQGLLWFVASAACAFGAYFETVRIHRALQPGDGGLRLPGWLGLLPFLVALPSGIHALQRGQVSIVLLWLELTGLRLAIEGRGRPALLAAGLSLAAAASLKLVPIVPALVLLAGLAAVPSPPRGARRGGAVPLAAGLAAGLAFFLAVAPALAVGPERYARLLQAFAQRVLLDDDPGRAAGIDTTASGNQSLLNAFRHARDAIALGRPRHSLGGLPVRPARGFPRAAHGLACLLLGAAALAVAVVAGRRADRAGLAASFGLAMAAALLASPISWDHQFVQLVPAAAFSGRALLDRGRPRSARAVTASLALLVGAAYVVPHGMALGLLGLSLALWLLVTAALLLASAPAKVVPYGSKSEKAPTGLLLGSGILRGRTTRFLELNQKDARIGLADVLADMSLGRKEEYVTRFEFPNLGRAVCESEATLEGTERVKNGIRVAMQGGLFARMIPVLEDPCALVLEDDEVLVRVGDSRVLSPGC